MRIDQSGPRGETVRLSNGECAFCGRPGVAEWHDHVPFALCLACGTGIPTPDGPPYSRLGALIGDVLTKRMEDLGWAERSSPGLLDAEIKATLARLESGIRYAIGTDERHSRQRAIATDPHLVSLDDARRG